MPGAVSYTHLDVYKRQSLLTAISYLERIFETIDEPVAVKDEPDAVEMPPITGKVTSVSYTHLDVYKRQPQRRQL